MAARGGIAVVFGLALGLFVGWDRTVYAGLYPLMVGFNSIPKVAVVPICLNSVQEAASPIMPTTARCFNLNLGFGIT